MVLHILSWVLQMLLLLCNLEQSEGFIFLSSWSCGAIQRFNGGSKYCINMHTISSRPTTFLLVVKDGKQKSVRNKKNTKKKKLLRQMSSSASSTTTGTVPSFHGDSSSHGTTTSNNNSPLSSANDALSPQVQKQQQSSSSFVQQPSPQKRILSNSNISLRKQIAFVKAFKKSQIRSGTINGSAVATASSTTNTSNTMNGMARKTAYRKKLDPKEEEIKSIQRSKRGQDPDWDVILNATLASPLVILDAYNIIHQWPRLKKHLVSHVAKSRELLLRDLENLRIVKGWRIEAVFDGAGRRSTSGAGRLGDSSLGSAIIRNRVSVMDQQSKTSVSNHGVRVVYSGVGMSADSYIEERCYEAKKVTEGRITGSLIVASNDAMIRMAGQNAGAYCMSADRFVEELRAVRKAILYKVEVGVAEANGQSVRPEKLRNQIHLPSLYRRNGHDLIIEDKRKSVRKKNLSKKRMDGERRAELKDIVDGTKIIPQWAIVPNSTNPHSR